MLIVVNQQPQGGTRKISIYPSIASALGIEPVVEIAGAGVVTVDPQDPAFIAKLFMLLRHGSSHPFPIPAQLYL